MLRESLRLAGQRFDLTHLDDATEAPAGSEIVAFTRALVGRDGTALQDARTQLVRAVGEASAAAVAGSVGNFEMMNRILDATGVPTPGSMTELVDRLGLPTR